MNNSTPTPYVAKAFLSCSLRPEDKQFVDYIERILRAYKIEPVGTVGRYSVSPENPAELMKKEIPNADFAVIVATPRYLQQDLRTGQISYGLSEMIHIETGIAYAFEKPVVVFVQEGTNVGNFIPNITQYIILNDTRSDFEQKRPEIHSLLNSTYQIVKKIKSNKTAKAIGKVAVLGLAAYGAYKLLPKLLNAIFGAENT